MTDEEAWMAFAAAALATASDTTPTHRARHAREVADTLLADLRKRFEAAPELRCSDCGNVTHFTDSAGGRIATRRELSATYYADDITCGTCGTMMRAEELQHV
jgi:hypothetical protein